MGKLTEKEKSNALNEVRILASIDHPNVISYKEAFYEDKSSTLCIVMEMADGGDLLNKIERIRTGKEGRIVEKTAWSILIQMIIGLEALHELKIIHRDLKCANIFLTKEGVVKIGDLNVSKVAKRGLLKT
jgi:NIMA (never in mitosis gene a)-related kinase